MVLKRLALAVLNPYLMSPRMRRTGALGRTYNLIVDHAPRLAEMINPKWTVEKRERGLYLLALVGKDGGKLWLDPRYASILWRESEIWSLVYLPSFSLAGKTVLDVGAGQGETADFFFKHGAKKVICIEPEQRNCEVIQKNARMNGWDVEIINEFFNLGHLSIPHDFLKMDIEGGETLLLEPSVEALGPCRMEVHPTMVGKEPISRLIQKFRLKCYDQADMWGRND